MEYAGSRCIAALFGEQQLAPAGMAAAGGLQQAADAHAELQGQGA